jgi:glycosyltransferase involved in cell wall biosynthesis
MTETLPSTEASAGWSLRRPTVTLTDSADSGADRPVVIPTGGAPQVTISHTPEIDLSVVVPYYNPGERLRRTVEHLVRVLDGSGLSYELITVSDGSTDGSPFTLAGFPDHAVRRVSYVTNVGKGHALRVGLSMGRGRYLGFIDSDGDISPEFLTPFLAIMRDEEPDFVIGSKRHSESSVQLTPVRRLSSRLYQGLIRLLFRLNVKDTQVGIKLVNRRVVADVLPMLREERFALDLELLVLAHRLGYTRIVEAPVRIEERVGSTVSLKAAWRLLADTVMVFVRTSTRRAYDIDAASREGGIDRSEAQCPIGVLEVTAVPGQIPA